MRDGEVVACRADHLLTLVWQAAMTVLTVHSRRHVYKPAVVDCYNNFMNGVVFAALFSKTVNWWRKIVCWLIEMPMVNSYILYKDTVASPKSHVAYHRSVIESLAS